VIAVPKPLYKSPVSKELSRLNKLRWKCRLDAALKDGIETEGPGVVHAAIQEAVKTLGINAPSGAPKQEIPEGVLKAAKYWVDYGLAPTMSRLAQVAGMSRQAFSQWQTDPRFYEAVAEQWVRKLYPDDDKQK
jgi:hypothetical protein